MQELNALLQNELNPLREHESGVAKFGWEFRPRDKVIQVENDYEKDVFNGDIGLITGIDPVEKEVRIRFDQREVIYDFADLDQLALAYAITVHKAQGSEFDTVWLLLPKQDARTLSRELLYTGVTRARRELHVCAGEAVLRAALARHAQRVSGLASRLRD